MLYTSQIDTESLFEIGGPDVRITGLRLRGPDPERRSDQMRQLFEKAKHSKVDGYYSIPNSNGIICDQKNLEIDNCQISGWTCGAVNLRKGALNA